jgi:hypothetical protein
MTVSAWGLVESLSSGLAYQAGVNYNNRLIMSGGLSGITPISGIFGTPDGRNFDTLIFDQASFTARAYHAMAVYDERMWVSGGLHGVTRLTDVRFSRDGLTWEKTADMPVGVSGHKLVGMGDALVHLGGFFGLTYGNTIATSVNGVGFDTINVEGSQWAGRAYFGALFFDNRLWVFGGRGTKKGVAACYNDVWSSADLVHWDKVVSSAPWRARSSFGYCVWDNRMWVIAGRDTEGATNTALKDVWFSRDCFKWHKALDFPATMYGGFAGVIDNHIHVYGGIGTDHNVYKMNLG